MFFHFKTSFYLKKIITYLGKDVLKKFYLDGKLRNNT
ncbi:hypothetical protein CHY_1562 [Carboxydothermus hydrogenoformans Z-2901]|uniref:Uncharacterized protein n=1 Tax=Carboxydothermus hydrogenoformans (strain ATCC BAA-161 / DSM 6008 / Z-2901) TaxID=246194 RepID=Q3ABU3_CARHZ|nr:hypothetical protein CHY_1562 [Carboxydothermus hydrogenoformans Z-2901]